MRKTDEMRFYRICMILSQTTGPSFTAKHHAGGCTPKEGLSNPEANDNGDNKTELKHPEVSRRMGWLSSSQLNTRDKLT